MSEHRAADPREQVRALYAEMVEKAAALVRDGRMTVEEVGQLVRTGDPEAAAALGAEQTERLAAALTAAVERSAGSG